MMIMALFITFIKHSACDLFIYRSGIPGISELFL